MKILQFLLTALICILSSCTTLQRGFDGAALISTSRPEAMVSAPGLPTLAEGQIAPFLYTDRGYQFPSTLIGVYGTDAESPMAITAISFVPNDLWEWDSADFSGPYGIKTSGAVFGGREFAGTARVVDGANDPFSPLIAADEEQRASISWLAQRFVSRADFNRAKIILEYREPMLERLSNVDMLSYDERMQAFTARAAKAFQVQFGSEEGDLPRPTAAAYLNGLNAKTLGVFLGSMSPKEVLRLRP